MQTFPFQVIFRVVSEASHVVAMRTRRGSQTTGEINIYYNVRDPRAAGDPFDGEWRPYRAERIL